MRKLEILRTKYLLLIVFTLLPFISAFSQYKKGDVDCDGSVTMNDANMVVNAYLGSKSVTNFNLFDVDCDGSVSMADANRIANIFLEGTIIAEPVDLGLSVKWASCNVGAKSPEDYGEYFAWGETTTRQYFGLKDYKWYEGTTSSITKYCISSKYGVVDNKASLESNDDVAAVRWGSWRIPTEQEWRELCTKCKWKWTSANGKKGYSVTGPNGKSIFLPLPGIYTDYLLQFPNENGYYWANSIYSNWSDYANVINMNADYVTIDAYQRFLGMSVRAVYNLVLAQSISITGSSNELNICDTLQLQVTIKPYNTTDPRVKWSSDNTSVATISDEGVVTTLKEGNVTFTATTIDGSNLSDTYSIVVRPKEEHEFVDLGLSVLWATCNIGATKPEEYGDYFAWGETTPKTNYDWSTYKWCEGEPLTQTKYCTNLGYGTIIDNKVVLELADDAASINWGVECRMPTREEQDEIRNENNCRWVWTTRNGINGYEVTSKVNDNSIFLPAAGFYNKDILENVNTNGYYLSSSLYQNLPHRVCGLNFSSKEHSWEYKFRYYGKSVRAVRPKNVNHIQLITSIAFDTTETSMFIGEEQILSISVFPKNATDKSVTWESSDASVATVDANGKITALKVGTTVITATASDGGGVTATCNVMVNNSNMENGHEFVDLGLSVKWATCNVGATKPEDYGDYFAWGETKGYGQDTSDGRLFDWENYKWCNGSSSTMTKYCLGSSYGTVDKKKVLDKKDDAASVNWGGSWRMPTKAEQDELRNTSNCTWTWTTMNGVYGYKVVSKKNGNSIFLPAAGSRYDSSLGSAGSGGSYWSSSLREIYSSPACYLYFDSGYVDWKDYGRYLGRSVRAVCP